MVAKFSPNSPSYYIQFVIYAVSFVRIVTIANYPLRILVSITFPYQRDKRHCTTPFAQSGLEKVMFSEGGSLRDWGMDEIGIWRNLILNLKAINLC